MDASFILGNIAAVLTSASFLPQVIKTVKTRDTSSISLTMYVVFMAGVLMWLAYGILIQSFPVILGNIVTIIFSGIILSVKLSEVWKKKK